ncbi:protein EFR3 homolog B isoform X1 [Tachysurus ichikawai]
MLPVYNRCAVHALTAAYLNLICQLTTLPTFCQHVHELSSRCSDRMIHMICPDLYRFPRSMLYLVSL